MKSKTLCSFAALGVASLVTVASAHEVGTAGLAVCHEGDLMVADAMNMPFASADGTGRVLEVNVQTGAC